MYWNGNNDDIFNKNLGKNTRGIPIPENRSAITINIFVIPFSFNVTSVIIGYRTDKAVINNVPIIIVITNTRKDIGE